MNKKQLIIPMLGMALLGGAAVGAIGFANAQSVTTPTTVFAGQEQKNFKGGGVLGTVASVSGTTITLTGSDGKTYTVDASKASLEKIQTIATSDLKTGDTLNVHGTINGTSVSAEHIMSGKLPEGGFGKGPGEHGKGQGRGPGVIGTVSAVSGSTLTVLTKDGTSYTVNAASAKVSKAVSGTKPTDSTVAAIAVGDTVGVQGTVVGTSVTAVHIMDGLPTMGAGRGPGARQSHAPVNAAQ